MFWKRFSYLLNRTWKFSMTLSEIQLKVHTNHQIIFLSCYSVWTWLSACFSSSAIKCLRTPMVHCCLPVLFFASNNKKGWIVSFLALPSLPDVTHCCFLSLFISVSFPSVLCSIVRVSFPHLHSLLLFYSFTRWFLSLSLMLPVVTSLLSLYAVPSSAFKVFLPPPVLHPSLSLLSGCRIFITVTLTRRAP